MTTTSPPHLTATVTAEASPARIAGFKRDTAVSPKIRITILTTAIAAAAVTTLFLLPDGLVITQANLPLLIALTIAFTLSEKLIFHIEARKDAVSYTPTEFGLAIGVLFLFPLELIIARTVGALIGMVILRRPPLFKLLFNLAHFAFETLLAVVLFRRLSSLSEDLVATWLSLLVALTAAVVVGGSLVALAVSQFEGGALERIRREVLGTPMFHVPPALFATLIAVSVMVDPRLGLIAATPVPMIWFMIRSHGALINQHLDLTSVHDFGRTVGDVVDLADIAAAAADSMADGTGAETVVLRLWDTNDAPVDAAVGSTIEMQPLPQTAAEAALDDLFSQPGAVRLGDIEASNPHLMALRDAGVHSGIIAPIADDRGPLGFAVLANYEATSEAFDHDSLDRVVAMAQQLAMVVRKAHLQSQIEHEAAHDRLTGLANRGLFEASINESLSRDESHAVLLIDLNRFKEINDSFSHQAGDRVLVEAANRIRAAAGPHAIAARFGGDEFAVIAPNLDLEGALALAETLAVDLEAPIDIGQATIAISASVGVAVAPLHGREVAALLHGADLAMYEAKTSGKRSTVYRPDLDTSGASQLKLLSDLRLALEQQTLTVDYQPQFDLANGAVVGAEALARWNHPILGPISPDVFVPLAEQSGLVEELTRQVLAKATSAAAEWHRRGWPLNISVNISAQSLLDERLETVVADALNSSELDPGALTLEITETTMMGDASRTHRILHGLARLGVRLSVDDFGTGFSSLTNLRHFPVAELKIDRSFILDMMNDSTDDVIVRSTIELGHNLGLTIVAEGIEDRVVHDRLVELGCDVGQGFGLCRPMALDQLRFWIHNPPEIASQGDRAPHADRPSVLAESGQAVGRISRE